MVIVLCATLVLYCCIVRAIVSQVLLMYAIIAVVTGPEFNVGVLSAEICVTACVSSNNARVVVIFTKNDV